MATMARVRDETVGGEITREMALEFLSERITVRELIRGRVYQEVQDYNARIPEYFSGLVQPANAERTLKGYRLRERRQIDWKEQYERAVEAFEHKGILVLVGDRQVNSVDEEIELRPDTQVSFVRLVMLVGG